MGFNGRGGPAACAGRRDKGTDGVVKGGDMQALQRRLTHPTPLNRPALPPGAEV